MATEPETQPAVDPEGPPQGAPEPPPWPSRFTEEGEGLRDCIRWFVKLRWLAIFGVAIATWISSGILTVIELPLPLYAVVALMAVFNATVWGISRRVGEDVPSFSRKLIVLQIGADLLFLTSLLHFAGGAENPFSFFYFFLVVISGILLGRRESYAAAAATILLFSGMAVLEQVGVLQHHHLRGYPSFVTGTHVGDMGPSILPPDGMPIFLPLHAFLLAFSLTALVMCYFVDLVTRALRASVHRERTEGAKDRAIMESMQEGIVCFGAEGEVLSCNRAARLLHGCGQDDCSSPCVCAAGRIDAHSVEEIVRDILGGRKEQAVFESARGERLLLNTLRPVTEPSGRRAGVVWVLVDLTETRRLQMEVLQHERSAVLAEIAAFVAHDVGNLLDGTLNGLRILEASAKDPTECAKWARELRARVEQVPAVVRGLVELSRRSMLHRETVDVLEVVHRAKHMLGVRAQQRGIRCELGAAPVPPLRGDGIYLSMAVVNLLLNAFDAVGRGGRVRIRVRPAGDRPDAVEIAVEDDGCGIDAADQERIFDPFYTTKSESGGTGLGLTIVRRIVQEHGGAIRVDSAPGKGSTFTITIPVAACRTPSTEGVSTKPHEGTERIGQDDVPLRASS